jgi:inorganic pyrophosphatase
MRKPIDLAAWLAGVPKETAVVVDSPRFSHVKRRDDGSIDFVSPLPCPFNYGSVHGTRADDRDRIDAIVLGPRLPAGTQLTANVLAVVRFVDAGQRDPKWVCARRPLTPRDSLELELFFRLYALAKRALNRVRGLSGPTRYEGLLTVELMAR